MATATGTSGKTKTTGKAATPARAAVHPSAAHQVANGAVMTKPDARASLVRSAAPSSAAAQLQAKLAVGKPNDSFEQQADAMAQKVVSMTPADLAKTKDATKPTTESPTIRSFLQKKDNAGALLQMMTIQPLPAPEKEKVKKKEDEKIQKRADEKIQKAPEPKIQQSTEKLQAKPVIVAPKAIQPKAEEKIQKKAPEKLQQKQEEKIQKKTDEKIQKAPDPKIQQSTDKLQAKPVAIVAPKLIQLKEEEKIQKKEPEKLQKKETEKLQKKTDEKIQKAPEPKIQQSADKLQAKPVAVIAPKPIQLKEEEKIQKKEPEKLQKKTDEKIQKAPEPKIQQSTEKLQAKPAIVATKPVQLKEEEKIQKKEPEKLQKKQDEKIQKAPAQPVSEAAPPVSSGAPAILKKEEEKLQKKEEEKIQKAANDKKKEEKIQKTTDEKLQKKDDEKIQKAAEEKLQKKEEEKIQKAPDEKIQKKEEEKIQKTADEKLQKKEEEKIQKAADEKLQKKEEEKIQKAGDEKLQKKEDASPAAGMVQLAAEGDGAPSPEFEAKLQGTLSGGTPMERTVRAYMESRFDADFSAVRFHMDMTAVQLCNEIGAQAFAYKNHVYFNRGKYQPDTDSGRFLIAHELTHVIQQGYAGPKGGATTEARPAAKAEEKVQAAPQAVSSTSPRIQRIGWDTVNNAVRRIVPAWTLLTVIMGYNPILGESVARSAINWFQALLDLIPIVGPSIFDKLRESGMIARAQAWLNSVMADLPSMAEIRATWDRCWSEMGILEGIDGNIAIFRRHFSPVFSRITTFVSRVLSKVVEFLRETLLRPLNNVVKDIPGWELICVLIGQNPLTGEEKQRTPMNVLRGVVAFIPGGPEKLDQLVQSRALERAYQWFITETTARNLTWARIRNTFTQAWDTLQASDILHPIDTFNRLRGIFSPLLVDLAGFAGAALMKLLEFIFEAAMGAGGARVLAIFKRVQTTFGIIIRDPVRFLGNLVSAVGQGVRQFMTNILTHLRNGVIEWLVGGLTRAGLQMPERWDLKGFLFFALQILRLTWDRVRLRLVNLLGERVVAGLEAGFQFLVDVREKGFVEAIKDRISEFFGNIQEMVLGQIRSWIQQRIVVAAITQLISMLSPVGAVIQAIIKTYNTVMFFIERINQIMAFVESIIDSISAIAAGSLGQAANFVERSMARFIPVMLGFLARFIGIGDIAAPIQRAVRAIQARVDGAIDRIVAWVRTAASRVMAAGRSAISSLVNWLGLRKSFRTRNGESHSIFVEEVQGRPQLMIASQKQPFDQYLNNLVVPASDTNKTTAKNNAVRSSATVNTELANLKTMEATFGARPTSAQTGQLNQKQQVIRAQYDILATSVATLGIGNSREETVVTDIQPKGGSKLRSIAARPLTALRGNTVGNPNAQSERNVPGWSVLDGINARRNNDRTIYNDWVRMHLIHSSLHGEARAYNLVAAPRSFNTMIYNSIESPAVRAVLEPGTILHYSVSIQYNNPAPVADFPSNISYTWGKLKRKDDGTFENDGSPIASGFGGQTLQPPQVTPGSGPPTYILKNMGRPHMQRILGMPQDPATRISAATTAYPGKTVYDAMDTYYAEPDSLFNERSVYKPYSRWLAADKQVVANTVTRHTGTYIIDLN